jgi:hypothetical protein
MDDLVQSLMTHSVTSRQPIAATRKVYSITSSEVASIVDGMFKPGAFGGDRLIGNYLSVQ